MYASVCLYGLSDDNTKQLYVSAVTLLPVFARRAETNSSKYNAQPMDGRRSCFSGRQGATSGLPRLKAGHAASLALVAHGRPCSQAAPPSDSASYHHVMTACAGRRSCFSGRQGATSGLPRLKAGHAASLALVAHGRPCSQADPPSDSASYHHVMKACAGRRSCFPRLEILGFAARPNRNTSDTDM
jgi:hypothetical protein